VVQFARPKISNYSIRFNLEAFVYEFRILKNNRKRRTEERGIEKAREAERK
jgi:hypothetical protein